jgi:hypothetical protein
MQALRYLICILVALAVGAGTIYGIGQSGLAGEGGLAGGIYSNLVIYPAAILVACFGFWIVYAATDPGSDK